MLQRSARVLRQAWACSAAMQQETCQSTVGAFGASLSAGQCRNMFIQTQTTPNPSSLMFLPGKPVMASGSKDFKSAREGMASPLASKLFQVDGVESVFFGADFVTIKVRSRRGVARSC